MKYYYAKGRRKTATTTVRIYEGKAVSQFNGKPVEDIYTLPQQQSRINQPFKAVNMENKFYFTANGVGGGVNGQLDALVLAISRALIVFDPELKPLLKAEDLVTRDDRKVERKKTGLRKARKKPQFSKR